MIITNFFVKQHKLHLVTNETKFYSKYNFNGYINSSRAKECNLYGFIEEGSNVKGIMPLDYLLRARLTERVENIILAGTTMNDEANNTNRQDYISLLKKDGALYGNILTIKHELDNSYDPLAIAIQTVGLKNETITLGYVPRFRPNRKNTTFSEDSGKTSNTQKNLAYDQEKRIEDQEYILTGYEVLGGYTDKDGNNKHYGLLVHLGRKKQVPIDLTKHEQFLRKNDAPIKDPVDKNE